MAVNIPGDIWDVDKHVQANKRLREENRDLIEENERLRKALQPFANLRVDESASTEGPDRDVSVGVVNRHGIAKVIALGVYDNVIPSRWVYAARRTLRSR
jgi:hypothetical protein